MAAQVPELWRTQLCIHGSGHRNHQGDYCSYAHALWELLPPDESTQRFTTAWRDGKVDRWYGQPMEAEQIFRIYTYACELHPADVPVWVRGALFYNRFRLNRQHTVSRNWSIYDQFMPWDYGLHADQLLLYRMRLEKKLPFEEPSDLWTTLRKRKAIMSEDCL